MGLDEGREPLTRAIIGAAIEVHRELGPGLLESAYRACLAHELRSLGLKFAIEQPLPLIYKGQKLPYEYRLDLVVENLVVVELKSVESLSPVHRAQLLTYLRLTGCEVGLLMNFNVPVLKNGIRRLLLDRK